MNLSSIIDHTNLKPSATNEEIIKLCDEAIEFGFASVCINPYYINLVKQRLCDTKVKICSVSGFPLGSSHSQIKFQEVKHLLSLGCHEIDMVLNLPALFNNEFNHLLEEISEITNLCHDYNSIIKIIIETSLLSTAQIITASELVISGNADFIKTSTGFFTRGANLDDIKIIKSVAKDNIGIKASGGIKTYEFALELVNAGATRIGTSASVLIVQAP